MSYNLLKAFFFAFLFVFFASPAKATHLMGSDISYTSVDSFKYKIRLTLYRDCRGIGFPGVAQITVESPGFSSQTFSMPQVAVFDATLLCNSALSPCTPTNTPSNKGIEAHVYELTIDFDTTALKVARTAGACIFNISYSLCCRNGAITTGQSSANFYTFCYINTCLAPINSSPTFSGPPRSFACCNQTFYGAFGGEDFNDFDSLSYELVTPLGSSRTNLLPYTPSLSATAPMTAFCPAGLPRPCTPSLATVPPMGFNFDKKTGQIVFQPTNCSEVGTIAIQINEYRKIAGVMKLIGIVRRDIQIWIENCSMNNPPTITANTGNKLTVNSRLCEQVCIELSTKDVVLTVPPPGTTPPPDTTFLSVLKMPEGGSFRIINPSEREKKGLFCWDVPKNLPHGFTTQVTFEVKDNRCPQPGFSQYTVEITIDSAKVLGKIEGYVKLDTNNNCKADTLEQGLKRFIISGKTRSTVSATDNNGYYGYCITDDSATIGLRPSPFFVDTCQKDTFIKIKKAQIHKTNFSTSHKKGLYGQIFWDQNTNCVLDVEEQEMLTSLKIVAQPGNMVSTTDAFGRYYLPLDSTEVYQIYVVDSARFNHKCNTTFQHSYIAQETHFANNTFLTLPLIDAVYATTTIRSFARLSFKQKGKVSVFNKSFSTLKNVKGILQLDSNLKNIVVTTAKGTVSAKGGGLYHILLDSLPGDTLAPNLQTLSNFQNVNFNSKPQVINIEYTADTPYYNIDSTFLFHFYIDSLPNNQSLVRLNDTLKRRVLVTAAYDPNVKSTYQYQYITPVDSRIDYHIQFQNTGTDTAINVIVMDTLPAHLNYSSFVLKNASHGVRPVLSNNILHLYFDNIYLPDDKTNFEASIGNFEFSLIAYDTIIENKDLFNSASIYFDVQEPVRTNISHIIYHSPTEALPLPKKIICQDQEIEVPFKRYYQYYNNLHEYSLEMSAVADDFSNPIPIMVKVSNLERDTFKFQMPIGTASGLYFFRILGSPDKAIPFLGFYSDTIDYKARPAPGIAVESTFGKCLLSNLEVRAVEGFTNYRFVFNGIQEIDHLTDSVYTYVIKSESETVFAKLTYKNTCVLYSDTLTFTTEKKDTVRLALLENTICNGLDTFKIINSSNSYPSSKYYFYANDVLQDSASSLNTVFAYKPAFGQSAFRVVSSTLNGCKDTSSLTGNYGIAPIPGFAIANDTLCNNQQVQLSATTQNNGNGIANTTYHWGDGSSNSLANHTYTQFGIFDIRQRVSDSFNCTDSLSQKVYLINTPEANFTYTLDSCLISNVIVVSLNNNFKGEVVLDEWLEFGDNTTTRLQNDNHSYVAPNTYTLRAIAINNFNCSDTQTKEITVYANPSIAISNTTMETCFRTHKVLLAAQGSGYNSLNWNMDNGTNLATPNLDYTYVQAGNYNIELIAIGNGNCKDTQTVNIDILPDFELMSTVNNVCFGADLFLQIDTNYLLTNNFNYNFAIDGQSYSGDFNGTPNIVIPAPSIGNYTTVIYADAANGCSDTIELSHWVAPNPSANFDVTVVADRAIITNLDPQVKNTWDFGNGDKNIENNNGIFNYSYLENGDYTIGLLVKDINNCEDTASKTINILNKIDFYIPNAYSPNNDGKNDQFIIGGTIYILDFKMELFNRWGQKIVETADFNDPLKGLDLKGGVYLYQVYIQDVKKRKHYLNGEITVLK